MYADIPQDGPVATEWRGPFWEQKFWDSVVDCPKGWGQMLAQLGSVGYANVTDVVFEGLRAHKWNVPGLKTFITSADHHRHTFDSVRCLFDSTTAESVTNHNEAELQRRCQERQLEIDHMQQVLETKIQLLQEVRLITTSGCLGRHDVKKCYNCFHVDVGSPASTQRGGEDGLAGWITVPALPPLL